MNRLKELRIACGISQAKLASSVGVTQRNVSYWESGKDMPFSVGLRIAQFLQVEPEYLAGFTDELGHATSPLSAEYSAEEKKLISDFRSLSPENRALILQTVEALIR